MDNQARLSLELSEEFRLMATPGQVEAFKNYVSKQADIEIATLAAEAVASKIVSLLRLKWKVPSVSSEDIDAVAALLIDANAVRA
jgi:hypothetical protein